MHPLEAVTASTDDQGADREITRELKMANWAEECPKTRRLVKRAVCFGFLVVSLWFSFGFPLTNQKESVPTSILRTRAMHLRRSSRRRTISTRPTAWTSSGISSQEPSQGKEKTLSNLAVGQNPKRGLWGQKKKQTLNIYKQMGLWGTLAILTPPAQAGDITGLLICVLWNCPPPLRFFIRT